MKRKKLGLVLGSGSARGFSHIGVLSVLEANGVRPDYVAGTSIGAAIGALYCSGMAPEYLKKLAISTEWQDLIDFTVPKTGMIAGNKVEEYMQSLTNNCSFKELKIPLRVVATDLSKAEKIIFSEGNVAKAVRASISIPGVFSPVAIDSRELVDGALMDPLPIDIVRDMGADIIIAVDLSKDFGKARMPGSKVRQRSTFYDYMKKKFIRTQVDFFKEFIMETKRFRLPQFAKRTIVRLMDRHLNVRKLLGAMTGRHMPDIMQTAVMSMNIMQMQIYRERVKSKDINILIRPQLNAGVVSRFEDAFSYITAGEKATIEAISDIRRLMKKK